MRPLTLRMKAFISYKDETIVDFTKMSEGLFLIKGGTGAGKTTIFDGIMFALFGRAGGSQRNVQAKDSFHCNLVPKSQDTEVELTFLQDGKIYRVERKIHFRKSRGTENEYTLGGVNAVLYPPEGEPISSDVTSKIVEIIGLSDTQFERIIMLAQGEFEKFLLADSDEKHLILQKIFDNSIYERYADSISETAKLLFNKRKDAMTAIENQMENAFLMPELMEDEAAEKYHYASPELLSHLKDLVEKDEQELKALELELKKKNEAADALNKKQGAAKINNDRISELQKKREHEKELLEKKEEMDLLSNKYESIRIVVSRIKPLLDMAMLKESERAENEKAIGQLSADIEKKKAEKKALEEQCKKDQQTKKEADKLQEEATKKSALLSKYDEFSELSKRISEREKKLASDRKDLEKKKSDLNGLEELLTKESNEASALQNAESALGKAESRLELQQKKTKDLRTLMSGKEAVLSEEKALIKLQDAYLLLEKKAKDEKEKYDRKYELFIEEQSALIASKTSEKLEELGEVDCPVCGTHLVKGKTVLFAKAKGEIVDQDAVDEAKKIFEKAEAERAESNKEIATKKASLETRKDELLKSSKELLQEDVSWEDLAGDEYLEKKVKKAEDDGKDLAAEVSDLKQKSGLFKTLTESVKKNTEKKTALIGEVGSLTTGIDKEGAELFAWKKDQEKLSKSLEFGSKNEAEKDIETIEKKARDLLDLVEKNKALLEACGNALTGMEAALFEKNELKNKIEKDISETKENLAKVLKENKFASEKEATEKIEDLEDPEKWISETESALNEYRNDVKNTSVQIADLVKKTEKLEWVDLEALSEELNAAVEERDLVQKAVTEKKIPYENHKQTLDLVGKKKKELASTEKAWTIIDRLSRIAQGSNAEGGKMSFGRYVMGSHFKEVLEMANLRLDKMTGGKYQFVHKTTSEYRNRKAGLDVEIFDQIENATISKQSLSGGEKFLVSMCLALGLSDVTQNRSGGKALDTLFIDEGFGSLDDEYLDMAMNVLNGLTDNHNRLVGIISHINTLDDCIHQKIRVEKGVKGSGSFISYEGT